MDVEVGILLTFLESMKAKVRLYQKYVVSTREKLPFFKYLYPLKLSDTKVVGFAWNPH